MTREELVAELDAAITDTLDAGWLTAWGAEACVKRLEALGLFPPIDAIRAAEKIGRAKGKSFARRQAQRIRRMTR